MLYNRKLLRFGSLLFALVLGFAITFFVAVTVAHGAPLLDAPWEPNVKVNDDATGVADQGAPALAASKTTSDVFAVWQDYRNDDADIYFARSVDGGSTWGASVRVNHDAAGYWQFEPDIAIDAAGIVHVVWSDSRAGDDDIYYARSADGGQTWSAEVRVSDVLTGSQYAPAIAVQGNTTYRNC
jgi:hypothetical protein